MDVWTQNGVNVVTQTRICTHIILNPCTNKSFAEIIMAVSDQNSILLIKCILDTFITCQKYTNK